MGQPVVLCAGLRVHFQRVYIKEPVTGQGHTADNAVVQRPLHHIAVFAPGGKLQHPAGKHHQTDGGAGFAVHRVVGQVIVIGKGFAVFGRADGTGNVHPAGNGALPQPAAGFHQGFVPGFPCHGRHAGIQVHGPHSVAFGVLLFPDRLGCLKIAEPQGSVRPGVAVALVVEIGGLLSPLVDEVFGQRQMVGVAGDPVQLHQGQLQLLMAGIALLFALFRAEHGGNMGHTPEHDVEQPVFSRGLIVSHRRFQHMAGAVHLVVVPQVGPALVQPVDDIVGIQIAVGLLSLFNELDGFIHGFFQLRVRVPHQRIGCGFQPLGQIAVLKYKALEGAGFQPGGNAEIVDAVAGLRALHPVVEGLPLIGENPGAGQLLIAAPEGVGDGYLRKGDRDGEGFFHGNRPF